MGPLVGEAAGRRRSAETGSAVLLAARRDACKLRLLLTRCSSMSGL